MPAFKSAHMKRYMIEKTGTAVSELNYQHGINTHGARAVAMLGATARMLEHKTSREHGNSTKAKEANRMIAELMRLSFEIEEFYATQYGEQAE